MEGISYVRWRAADAVPLSGSARVAPTSAGRALSSTKSKSNRRTENRSLNCHLINETPPLEKGCTISISARPHRKIRNTMRCVCECDVYYKWEHFVVSFLTATRQFILTLEICVTVQSELWRPQGRRTLLYLAAERNHRARPPVVVIVLRRRRRASRSRPVSIHTSPPLPSPCTESSRASCQRCSALLSLPLSVHTIQGTPVILGTWRGDHGHLLRVSSIFWHFKFQLRCAIKFWKALSLLRYPFHKAQKFLLTRVSRDGTRSPN